MANDPLQARVVDFLRSGKAWPVDKHAQASRVDVIETHGALVFMAGDTALKVRRAVRFPYMDFSTLEARRHYAERELALNQPHAPDLYRRVVAITEDADGTLSIGGCGRAVEWAVEMARFAQADLLSEIATRDGIDDGMARALADAVLAYHAGVPARPNAEDRVPKILQSVMTSLAGRGDADVAASAQRLLALGEPVIARSAAVRAMRRSGGFIRRCHGDLHLGNIVLWHGKPVPFDAIEFDEAIATIDTLYDLAFLVMDLDRLGARRAANIVLGHYLWRSGDARDLAGLTALPLYLALRASIRAMVTLDRARVGVGDAGKQRQQALAALSDAEKHLASRAPLLVAVGGLSGSGKTTLARALAPLLWPTPGAVHLRSDLERKWLAGVAETERLPRSAYTQEASSAAYARVMQRAAAVLAAGHSVVVDAVFAKPEERVAIEALATQAGVGFRGFWLSGSAAKLKDRVASRTADASDATPEVVDKQFAYDLGAMTWTQIDADADVRDVETRAAALMLGRSGSTQQ